MNREEVLDALRGLEPELRRRGVTRAGLFGSTARGEHGADSDIDILVSIDPSAPVGVFAFVGLQRLIAVLIKRRFRRNVDVVELDALKALVRVSAERDVVYAF